MCTISYLLRQRQRIGIGLSGYVAKGAHRRTTRFTMDLKQKGVGEVGQASGRRYTTQ